MSPGRTLPAAAALVIAVAAVSWAAILVRLCDAPSLGIAFWRLLIATVVLLPWGMRRARGGRVAPRTWGLAAVAGALLAVHFASWIASLSYTSVASSVLLVAMQPVFTGALGPALLGERPRVRAVVAILLAVAGTAVVAGGDLRLGSDALLGDGLALLGALTAALYLMIGRGVRDRIGFGPYLSTVYAAATGVLLAMAATAGTRLAGYPARTWLWLVLLAAGPHLLGHGLLNWSVRRIRALTVNLAVLGEPILATLYAAALFGEVPPAPFWPGAGLILAGIALAAREEGRSPVAAPT